MPMFFFDLHNDEDVIDTEGKSLPSAVEAGAHGLEEPLTMVSNDRKARIAAATARLNQCLLMPIAARKRPVPFPPVADLRWC